MHSIVLKISFGLQLAAPTAVADNPQLEFALGILAESRGDEIKALHLFESARQSDPGALPLVNRAISAKLNTGDRAGAISLFRELAEGRKKNLSIQISYADFLTEQGSGDSLATKLANETLLTALLENPGHPEIIRRLFQYAATVPDRSRQSELLEMLSAAEPSSAILYASLANALIDPGDLVAREKIDRRFLKAMEHHPELPTLARAASDHFQNTGRTAQAISILKHHVEAAPSSLDLRTRLGILCFSGKRNLEGENELKEVLRIHPRQALAHRSLAKFYRLQNQPDLSRKHASELLKIRRASPAEFIQLADEWLAASDARQARLLLENAVFSHPGNYELASRLAIATQRDPETRENAARLFREAEAVQPTDGKSSPEFLIESAEAMIAGGHGKAAEERIRAAIRAYPPGAKKETATALRRLAEFWESQKRHPEAAKALRQRADALDS